MGTRNAHSTYILHSYMHIYVHTNVHTIKTKIMSLTFCWVWWSMPLLWALGRQRWVVNIINGTCLPGILGVGETNAELRSIQGLQSPSDPTRGCVHPENEAVVLPWRFEAVSPWRSDYVLPWRAKAVLHGTFHRNFSSLILPVVNLTLEHWLLTTTHLKLRVIRLLSHQGQGSQPRRPSLP